MTLEEWLKLGFALGYCGNTHCYTHNGAPMSSDEQRGLDKGNDWCMSIVRVYETAQDRDKVENIGYLQ